MSVLTAFLALEVCRLCHRGFRLCTGLLLHNTAWNPWVTACPSWVLLLELEAMAGRDCVTLHRYSLHKSPFRSASRLKEKAAKPLPLLLLRERPNNQRAVSAKMGKPTNKHLCYFLLSDARKHTSSTKQYRQLLTAAAEIGHPGQQCDVLAQIPANHCRMSPVLMRTHEHRILPPSAHCPPRLVTLQLSLLPRGRKKTNTTTGHFPLWASRLHQHPSLETGNEKSCYNCLSSWYREETILSLKYNQI